MFGVYRYLQAHMVLQAHRWPSLASLTGPYAVFGFYTPSGYLMTLTPIAALLCRFAPAPLNGAGPALVVAAILAANAASIGLHVALERRVGVLRERIRESYARTSA